MWHALIAVLVKLGPMPTFDDWNPNTASTMESNRFSIMVANVTRMMIAATCNGKRSGGSYRGYSTPAQNKNKS